MIIEVNAGEAEGEASTAVPPKRAFVRGLFGDAKTQTGTHAARQRSSVEWDLQQLAAKEAKFRFDYVTYVFGAENVEMLSTMGVRDIRLLDKRPYPFECRYLFRNKIEFIDVALQEFDEIIWLDWDCNPIKPVPSTIWDTLQAKDIVQACLYCYRQKQCPWRKIAPRSVANTGFLYIRERGLMPEVLRAWETTGKRGNDEIAFTYVMDQLTGGWQSYAAYYARFEPEVCRLRNNGPYSAQGVAVNKNPIFYHRFGTRI